MELFRSWVEEMPEMFFLSMVMSEFIMGKWQTFPNGLYRARNFV
jgi:hypothetical protein